MLLWLGGQPSLAPRADGFTGGRVVVKGRAGAVIASGDAGIKQAEADKEKLVISTYASDWAAIKAKSGITG